MAVRVTFCSLVDDIYPFVPQLEDEDTAMRPKISIHTVELKDRFEEHTTLRSVAKISDVI